MSDSATMRREADRALREHLLPRLRAMGFEGSSRHFRRIREDRIDLVSVQFGKWGESFCVDIATCPPQGPPPFMGRAIPVERVTALDIVHGSRDRLTLDGAPGDCWFRYFVGQGFGPHQFDGTPDECALAAAAALAAHGEQFFETADRWWTRTVAE